MIKNGARSIQDAIPLKPVDMLVLMTLSTEDRHGYGIVTDITERTSGSIKLVPGNLYSVLRRLMGEGLIDEATKAAARMLPEPARAKAGQLHRFDPHPGPLLCLLHTK